MFFFRAASLCLQLFVCHLNITINNNKLKFKVPVCMCAFYLWSRLGENILSLNDVCHHSVFELLVLLSSQLDGLQLRPTTPTYSPEHMHTHIYV